VQASPLIDSRSPLAVIGVAGEKSSTKDPAIRTELRTLLQIFHALRRPGHPHLSLGD
jgi:hypothetical protein